MVVLLPARLDQTGDLTAERKLAQVETAQFELAVVSARTATHTAAVAVSNRKLRRLLELRE
jgi:hypothetical protein